MNRKLLSGVALSRRILPRRGSRSRSTLSATMSKHQDETRGVKVVGLAALLFVVEERWKVQCNEAEEEIENWSGTHRCRPNHIYTPETREEARSIVADHAKSGEALRPCGSTLSPNGVGFCAEDNGAMLNMALCDRILEINTEERTVRVEAGARVEQVLEALDPHHLTLENLASIAAQQMGGFVQVGAHGTGAILPPVDGQVLSFRLCTPAFGLIEMERGKSPFFDLALVSMGLFGIVLDITLRCVPKHSLLERVQVLTRDEAKKQYLDILKLNRHARLMWIPHVDAVVVVTNNPTHPPPLGEGQQLLNSYSHDERLAPLRKLLLECSSQEKNEIEALNFAQLRDELIKLNPLSLEHIKRINQAEAEFWRRSQGTDVADSSKKLNFECGGQQWVNECAFPTGSLSESSGADMQFMLDLLDLIESQGIPAPAPIEQRWTSGSSARMSPAHGSPDSLHSWVGIIMYLPTNDPDQRKAITEAFYDYKSRCESSLWPKYSAVEHWAKIELPPSDGLSSQQQRERTEHIKARLAARFPVNDFAVARKYFDPRGILGNRLLDTVLPKATSGTTTDHWDDY